MTSTWTRREAMSAMMGALSGGMIGTRSSCAVSGPLRFALFRTEVTPPLGHPLMGGGIAPAQRIEDPLFVHGFVLFGLDQPIVLAAVDWCEIRNDAYSRWQEALAEAARTSPDRVLLTAIHQHDAPIADLEAERILEDHAAKGRICDLAFHEETLRRVGAAVRENLQDTRRITHFGTGQAKVEKVASNRRYIDPDGKPVYSRMSATKDTFARDQPEGTIDPWLKTLSFWENDSPVVALSTYATHPMSYYGKGGVSADFNGIARRRRQFENPGVMQIYTSGCSGNIIAGKYNDGAPENRPVLADRIYQGMKAAWEATDRRPIGSLEFRTAALQLEPRNEPTFTVEGLEGRLTHDLNPFGQCLAALGLSWRKRADAGHIISVPVLDFGPAQLLLLPAESYVEFQLYAQQVRPDSFVQVMGYGECAPGYIPTEKAIEEGDANLHDWCWVAPGSEVAMKAAIEAALRKS